MDEMTLPNIPISPPIEGLNHVPMKALRELVDDAGGEQLKNATREILLDEVKDLVGSNHLSDEKISKLVNAYKFAGRVSVCWGIPLERKTLSKEKLEQAILDRSSASPFHEEIRPQLTQKPSFNKAEWISDSLLRLEFVCAGQSYEIEDNYEKRTIVPTKRLNSYLRIFNNTFFVETRASIRESKLVCNSVSSLLDMEVNPLAFSNQDIAALKKELHAKSKAAKHKRFGGDFDTTYVSASVKLDDLDSSEEYKQHFSDGELKEARLEFVYKSLINHSIDVSLHISSQGNIWFMSGVPEELIEYVFSVVRKIKFLPSIRKLGLASEISEDDENNIQSLIKCIQEKGYGQRFNPRIYKTLGFEIDERKWMETISRYVRFGYLTEKYELSCPHCHETISSYDLYKEIPLEQTIHCIHCNHEFEVSEQHIALMYSFKEINEPSQTPGSLEEDLIVLDKD
jgi:hypothetical protein